MKVLCSECSHEVAPGTLGRCPECGGILRPQYPDEAVKQLAKIEPGPGIDRYRHLLPVTTPLPFLGEGDTPLIPSQRLGASLGLSRLYFKNEGRNPSGAFKDRPAALAVTLAIEAGTQGIITASSGNAASATAAYAAAAGLPCVIFLEPGNPPAKIRQTMVAGARVVPIEGIFSRGPQAISDLITQVAQQIDHYPAFIWAPVNPYILEAIKSISYEIVARLGGAPDAIVCAVGGGDMLTAQWRAYLELKRAAVIDRLPRMIGVQSESAPPLLQAFRKGTERVATLDYANSNISGINVSFSGDHALVAVRESGGTVAGVTDEQAFAMQAHMGKQEGIWVEPVSAAAVAALSGLLERGEIGADEQVVCILSGAGFKDQHLAEEEAAAINRQKPIAFNAEAIVEELGR